MTEQDLRKTGKELFMEKQGIEEIDDLNLAEDVNYEENKEDEEEEEM